MYILRYDRGTLILQGGSPPVDGFQWDDRVNAWRAEALLYRELLLFLHRNSIPFRDEARAYEAIADLEHNRAGRSPREYQSEAIAAWEAAGKRGTVVLPTGTGKSFVAELSIASARRPSLVLAPTIDLVQQWASGLRKAFNVEVGMLGGGSHEICPITVSTYDSAYLHMDRYGDRYGHIIFDEAHHLPSESYSQIAELCIAPFRLAISATPERPDGRHQLLDRLAGPIVFRKGIKELAGDFLAHYEVIREEVVMTEEEHKAYDDARQTYRDFVQSRGIRMGGPQGWQRFLRESSRSKEGREAFQAHRRSRSIMHGAAAKLDALDRILQENPGRPTIIFTNDNATVYRISREFLIPCVTHQTEAKERKDILARFGRGDYRAVVTSRVLNEGVDLPSVEIGIVLSGTGTVREHVQRLGRILRQAKDKRAVLYEVITQDTSERFTSERRRDHAAYQ